MGYERISTASNDTFLGMADFLDLLLLATRGEFFSSSTAWQGTSVVVVY
jgi:hypothetical protein